MGWTNELLEVYEKVSDPNRTRAAGEPVMLPVSHSTANAQIELTVDENGNFKDAYAVSKENSVTVIPVTEDSGARSSGITPMPFADKLVYIAGDYGKFAEGKRADNSGYFSAYMEQLRNWCESDYSCPEVCAVYKYLEKGELMNDLVNKGVLEVVAETGRLTDKKINGIAGQDAFVRFKVSGANGVCETWKSKAIQDSFIKFNSRVMGGTGLCYATGEESALTYKHPSKIRNSGDKAKLISSNDESGYTYRGRFSNKEEAFAVSYDYSQKVHNALKWLVENERVTKTDEKGKTVTYNPLSFDSLTLVVWNSALGFVPSITESAGDMFGDNWDMFGNEEEGYSAKKVFAELLHEKLMGGKVEFDDESKVMIMGLDAATTGRLSIAVYTELAESQFAEALEKWHNETLWLRFDGKLKKSLYNSCSLPQIANCLYGTEQSGRLECDKKVLKDTILRLLPCVTECRKLPRDIVQTICNKASNPLAFDKKYNHTTIVENACALIRKAQLDNDNKTLYYKGEIKMAYDPNCNDRSYLFGCLLAIADKAESDTYDESEKRVTNARRLWSAFAARPCQTWKIIEERLEPYLEKDQRKMTRYTKAINDIMGRMSPEEFSDNSKLSPMYLIGFHHYNALLWGAKAENKEEE